MATTNSILDRFADEPLTLEEAFRRCTSDADLAYIDKLKAYSVRPLVWFPDDPYLDRYYAWRERRKPFEAEFIARIRRGELVLTGFAKPASNRSRREIIAPDLLEVLELDFETSKARGPGLELILLQVQPALASEDRVASQPNKNGSVWSPEFTHNADYTRVEIRGLAFDLSGGLCQIVRRLHEAHLAGDPWLNGKLLLAECNYGSMYMGDIWRRHPGWRELIASNRRGLYRLNLSRQHSGT